uniref:Uncharacterized protein n=1 Tax=Anguilla anguilla TaxID=7936 RepID=A0A0E9QF48_ANGAN
MNMSAILRAIFACRRAKCQTIMKYFTAQSSFKIKHVPNLSLFSCHLLGPLI